jgi:hypothetical protein
MNRDTLLAHRSLWVHEQTPYRATLTRLEKDERELFEDLVCDRFGEKVRLEQERVSYALLERELNAICLSLADGVEP